MTFLGGAWSIMTPVSGIDWFWAIVCNAMVIGGIVVPGLAFGLWWMMPPRPRHAPPK
jgi:hypothetical protein